MEPKFSASEIIQLAISMEEEGVKFYEKYADMADFELKKILLSMAEDEKQHAEVFRKMYNELNVGEEEENYFFEESVLEFFSSYTKNEGFNRVMTPIDSVKDALKIAADTERITINYYKGLLNHSSEEVGKILVRLIDEETKHLVRLEGLAL
ncbi:MAG: ferritin family protein [Vallitaleaceae bacterium]|nr:ferritin family protein [Vallitaleaceae bacterium]